MDEVQFQKEVFKLRDQEYPYYYQVGLGSGFRVKGVKALIRWLTPSFSPSLPPPLLPEQQTTSARPAGPVRHVGRPLQPGLLQLHLLHPLEGALPIVCFTRMECGRCLSIVRPIKLVFVERHPPCPQQTQVAVPAPPYSLPRNPCPHRDPAPTPPCPHATLPSPPPCPHAIPAPTKHRWPPAGFLRRS